jgi:Uma2 family endonuclease
MAIVAPRRQSVVVPVGPLTFDDLRRLPDESGLRYELIDGVLLMTPSPANFHQIAVGNLYALLREATPPGWTVMLAPFDWRIGRATVLQPDLFVIEHPEGPADHYEGVPLLAVEVLSPSTRQRDLGLKRLAYGEAGLETYWVVDPGVPSLTVFGLRSRRLIQVARVTGDEDYEATRPFPVQVVPAELIRP